MRGIPNNNGGKTVTVNKLESNIDKTKPREIIKERLEDKTRSKQNKEETTRSDRKWV